MFSEVSLYTEFKTVGTALHMVTPASILKVPRTPCALLLFINLIFVRPIDWSATCDFAAIYMHSYNTRYRSATMSHVSNSPSSSMPAPRSSLLDRSTILDIEPPAQNISPPSNPQSLLPITVPPMTPLKFSTIDITLWFHRFDARYRGLNLSEEQLYYELLNCLDDIHVQRISHLLRHQPPSFDLLKNALIKVYDIPAARRQFNLKQVPALGDQAPSELLHQLRFTLGKDDSVDETAKLLLLSEFLDRMPTHVRPILRLFQDQSLDIIAQKADALLQDDYSGQFSYSVFHESQPSPSFPSNHPFPAPAHISTRPHSSPYHPPLPHPSSRIRCPSTSNNQAPRVPNRAPLLASTHQTTNRTSDRSSIINGLCFYHRNYPQQPHYCVEGCQHYHSLNSRGGASNSPSPTLQSTPSMRRQAN